jgi:branched-chain amino acid transport system ATP-binding protein
VTVLSAQKISVRFGGLQALQDVSFEVNEHEIVGVIGPNGAGKTTLFNCVTGFQRPDAGEVRVHDEPVTALRPDERVRRGLARSFQEVGLVRSFTVLDNLLVAQHQQVRYSAWAGLIGLLGTFDEERVLADRAMDVLRYLDLDTLADAPVASLSYGIQKQVEVAAAIATDPTVLMLDEPLAGLGPEESERFGERLLRMRDDLGLAIVVIEHHVPFVLAVCDYLYVLDFGRLLAQGKPDEIRGNRSVAEAYLGKGATALT